MWQPIINGKDVLLPRGGDNTKIEFNPFRMHLGIIYVPEKINITFLNIL